MPADRAYKSDNPTLEMPILPMPPKKARAPYSTRGEGMSRIIGSRLTPSDLAGLPEGGPAADFARNLLLRAPAEDDRLTRFLSGELGGRKACEAIANSLFSATEYAPEIGFVPEEGGQKVQAKAILLYCRAPLSRAFLLTNASLSSVWWEQLNGEFCEHMSAIRSLKLPSNPGDYRFLYLVPKETGSLLARLCGKAAPAPAPEAPAAEPVDKAAHSDSGADLPALRSRHPKDDFEAFMARLAEGGERPVQPAPAPAEAVSPSEQEKPTEIMINTLGLTAEQLKEAKQNKVDNPEAMALFGGYEIQLGHPDPEINGMRLIVTGRHPSTIVDVGADRIGYIDPSKWMERKVTSKGKERKLYYILVRQGLEDTGRLSGMFGNGPRIDITGIGEPEEQPEEKGQPETKRIPDELLTERQLAVRKAAQDIYSSGNSIEAETFSQGGNMAALAVCDGRYFIVTDMEDAMEAQALLAEELAAEGREIRMSDGTVSMGRRRIALDSGGEIMVTIRSVAGKDDTLRMFPKREREAASATQAEDSSRARRCEQTRELIRNSMLHVPEKYLEEDGEFEFTEMSNLLFSLPQAIKEVDLEQTRGGWLIAVKTADEEYALFRFPCSPAGLSENVLGQYGAVFTAKGYPHVSYLLIRRQFLTENLMEVILTQWAAGG